MSYISCWGGVKIVKLKKLFNQSDSCSDLLLLSTASDSHLEILIHFKIDHFLLNLPFERSRCSCDISYVKILLYPRVVSEFFISSHISKSFNFPQHTWDEDKQREWVPQPLVKTCAEGWGIICGDGRKIIPQKRVHEATII